MIALRLRTAATSRGHAPFVVLAVATVLVGGALASFGPFQDTALYFALYESLIERGLWDAIGEEILLTGKFEPGLWILFLALDGLGVKTSETFLLVGYACVSAAVLAAGRRLTCRPHAALLVAALLSYWVVGREMYFWRAAISYALLVLGYMDDVRWRRFAFVAIAPLFHYSALAFVGLFVAFRILMRLAKSRRLAIVVSSLGVALILRFNALGDVATVIAARGDLDPYAQSGFVGHTLQASVAVVALLALLLLVDPARLPARSATLRAFFVSLLLTALLLADFYQLSSRLATPALLFAAFMAAGRLRRPRLKDALSVLLLVLAVVPTARLVFLLLSGSFDPQ